jgi:hypothetical protein
MANASSVIEAGSLRDQLQRLEHDHTQLREEYNALSRMQVYMSEVLQHLQYNIFYI